jgi:hypothetical protein
MDFSDIYGFLFISLGKSFVFIPKSQVHSIFDQAGLQNCLTVQVVDLYENDCIRAIKISACSRMLAVSTMHKIKIYRICHFMKNNGNDFFKILTTDCGIVSLEWNIEYNTGPTSSKSLILVPSLLVLDS